MVGTLDVAACNISDKEAACDRSFPPVSGVGVATVVDASAKENC